MKVNNGLDVIFERDGYYVAELDSYCFGVGYYDIDHCPLNDRYFIYQYSDEYLVVDEHLNENWYLRRYDTLLNAFKFVSYLLREDVELSKDPWYISCQYGEYADDSACYYCDDEYCEEHRYVFCPFI